MAESLAVLKKYPLNTKCGLCGKTSARHNAVTGGCPFGQRDRTGGYSFSTTQTFSPKMPRVKKQIRESLLHLRNTLLDHQRDLLIPSKNKLTHEEREANALKSLQSMDFAYWQLLTAILEHCNDKPTKRKRPIIV